MKKFILFFYLIGVVFFSSCKVDTQSLSDGLIDAGTRLADDHSQEEVVDEFDDADFFYPVSGIAEIPGESQIEVSIVDDAKLAVSSEVDVVVEATGNPLSGANNAIDAIRNGKHVTMVTVETDVLVGPELNKLASENDVVYSLAYGDQPALIEEMYDWAKSLGFDVIAAGKGTKYLDSYRFETPDNAYQRYGYTQEGFEKADLNPKMYNSFLDGTK